MLVTVSLLGTQKVVVAPNVIHCVDAGAVTVGASTQIVLMNVDVDSITIVVVREAIGVVDELEEVLFEAALVVLFTLLL